MILRLFIILSIFFQQEAFAIHPQLQEIKSFALALGINDISSHLNELKNYDLVVVDGINTKKSEVALLKNNGVKVVLGYLSIGTIEPERFWFKESQNFILDYWGDWQEWYVQANHPQFQKIIMKRVIPRLTPKNFDGLFLDNTDLPLTYPQQRRGMTRLISKISQQQRALGKLIFTQNGDRLFKYYADLVDGWNREDLSTGYNFTKKRYFLQKAKQIENNLKFVSSLTLQNRWLVLSTDYTKPNDISAIETSRANACAVGALPFVSNISLKRIPAIPITCTSD